MKKRDHHIFGDRADDPRHAETEDLLKVAAVALHNVEIDRAQKDRDTRLLVAALQGIFSASE